MDNNTTPKKLLVVGGGGFIGGFIADEALRRGFDTYVGVRQSTSRRFLTNPRLKFVVFDYDDADAVCHTLTHTLGEGERWDYIVYNLGATKCVNFTDFNRINFIYLRTFIEALRTTGMMPQRLLYMSSLSALGTGDEKGYTPMNSRMIPTPNTRYGVSKIKAETLLESSPDVPWTIFRPTGVYGPHEQDYLMMIKSIDRHWDFGVGFRRQLLTFIYVEDLARAIFDAIESPATLKKKYIISEGHAYTQRQFRTIVAQELGVKWVIPLRLPLWAVYAASVVAEKYGVAKMQASTLNRDKFKIMKQRNWDCDISDAVTDFGFAPRFSLTDGIKATVAEYRRQKAARKEGAQS